MFSSDYQWQHDYVRLVSDTGFRFERHKSDNFDKNKISSIDINRIIEERDFKTIDSLIPSITKYVLDPDQAQILDENFVKTFLLSQLSIQYLLYCKKYLDNTLIIVKKEIKKLKEDNTELNLFVEDLKSHISTLMKQIDEKSAVKCTQCNKIFSSEEFLNSHIKRRHSTPLLEGETDKLQMEIKELKGRLNNAEKMIQKEQTDIDPNLVKEADIKKIEDLQQKFEDLRLQVQSELKILQTQHSFQEKYEKWFEKMAFQGGGKLNGSNDFGQRRESTTQTDIEGELQEIPAKTIAKFEEKNKENIPETGNTHKQMAEFGEALEFKVTSSLQKIENQMQSFWIKLNDMERYRKKDDQEAGSQTRKHVSRSKTKNKEVAETPESEDTSKTQESPVRDEKKQPKNTEELKSKHISQDKRSTEVKIVKAYLKKTVESEEVEESSSKKDSPKKPLPQMSLRVVAPQTKKALKTTSIESEIVTDPDETTTSETLPSESAVTADSSEVAIKPQPLPRKRPHSSSTKKSSETREVDEELLKEFKVEIQKIIVGRLQDLGVSPDWNGLPTRSFHRAMEIVNHQANLMKKTYPNFDFTSTQIEKNVAKKVEQLPKQERKLIKAKPKKVETKKSSMGRINSPKIEIKNRKMYDTDSDSESRPLQVKETFQQISVPYSAVIEELKAVTSKIESGDKEVKASAVRNEDQTKGVLKSYPSVGSLTKKKVLFNLDTDEKKDTFKDGGSTTSVASSVFDGTPRKEEKKKDKEKDIEDLSDFDFSDM